MFARTIVDVRATATGGPRHGRIYLTPGRSYRRRMTKILHLGQTLSFTGDPFVEGSAAATHSSRGAVLVEDGRVIATGEADALRADHPGAEVTDHGDGLILPGFVDAHMHYPQTAMIAS